MKTDQFVAAVRTSAGIDSHDHAEDAVKATLHVLGERMSTEAGDLAAQLPRELAAAIEVDPAVERFDLPEFYHRVAAEEGRGCTDRQARQHARAVFAALQASVGAEYRHVLDQLPADYSDLTLTENVQH